MLTESDIHAILAEHEADPSRFPWRISPQDGQQAPEGSFLYPVELADGQFLAFWFSFGKPSPVAELDWKPAWHGVEGPMTRAALTELGRKT